MRMLNLSICLALPHTARLDIFALLRNIFALLRNIFALLRNIFAKAANSIYFRYAQIRYDINPRSRSEHIELLMAHSCHQQYIERRRRISKIRSSGFISMWHLLYGRCHKGRIFYILFILQKVCTDTIRLHREAVRRNCAPRFLRLS